MTVSSSVSPGLLGVKSDCVSSKRVFTSSSGNFSWAFFRAILDKSKIKQNYQEGAVAMASEPDCIAIEVQ